MLAAQRSYPGMFSAFCSTDAEALACELVIEVEHPVLGTLIRHGPPVQFSDTPARIATSCLRGDGHHGDLWLTTGFATMRSMIL